MTVLLLFLGLLALPSMLSVAGDPAPGLTTSIESSRRITCERASLEVARKARPGQMEDASPRGDFIERNAVLCAEPLMEKEERHPRDAAILAELSRTTTDMTSQLAALGDPAEERTWLVEVHYPNPAVGAKVSFAVKGALTEAGLQVTDRLPTLAVGDIEVISRTPPLAAYPLACKRYFARDRLASPDAVLSLLMLDSRETVLHAGTCVDGRWTWLR